VMKLDIIHKSKKLSRVLKVRLKGRILSTPTYFPAISSYGIKLPLSYLIYLLANYNYPRVLVSAYDIFHAKEQEKKILFSSIKKFNKVARRRNKGFLFLDSGIYESSWYDNLSWDRNSYKDMISKVKFDFYSSFDVLPKGSSKKNDKKFMKQTFENIIASRTFSSKGELVAILHGRSPDHLIAIIQQFVNTHPEICHIIAIPERDCGEGILERAQTIVEVRKILDKNDDTSLLHVLGCGNPLSILLYSFCGADIFDSLDWYEHVINQNTSTINDFSHLELFNCQCRACSFLAKRTRSIKGEYMDSVLLHNLFFYQDYMKKIQTLIRNDGILTFLGQRIGKDILEKIKRL
jgi:queuine/archaeosine tRNA-ribosyltransferase